MIQIDMKEDEFKDLFFAVKEDRLTPQEAFDTAMTFQSKNKQ